MGGDAADFDFGPGEVDQQAERLAGGAQIVAALWDMRIGQFADDLAFDNDLVLDQQAGGLFPNDRAIVIDDNAALLEHDHAERNVQSV